MEPRLNTLTTILAIATLVVASDESLEDAFRDPPDSARPGVYWYFMDGNLDREEMVLDLESMREVGIGNLVFLEVDVGVPPGPVKFMSEEWQDLFANAVHHAERLGIDITLGAGPGWTGSGGPWVEPEQSMQHLVFSTVETKGPGRFEGVLPVPGQRSTRWHKMRSPFYEDVVVYAFPKCEPVIGDIDEKALFERDPYTSMEGVKPYLPAPASYPDEGEVVDLHEMIDLSERLQPNGRLQWDVPSGEWTILRMGRRSTGASTRPAPAPGVGFDHDKLDRTALEDHFQHYYGRLLDKVGKRAEKHGWTTVHLDSWEMGAQNWTPKFREELTKRRGYDPLPFLVTFSGRAVTSVAVTERFLWDFRLTAQELVLENYAGHLRTLGRRHGFELSIEPYDMNPTADLDLGAVADVPMCEFWSTGFGFDSSFSCIEATSIAHTMGRPIVSAEAFTAGGAERWQQYPWSMKNQGDWAFAMGINRFVYHTFAHKPLGEEHRPGMTMGPYGVHWDRGQTWWPMAEAYHRYITRCSHLLRQGVTVSDILYLTPEGAPHVFRPPASALRGSGPLADKKGHGFDGCSPNILMERADVQDGRIVFPGGTSYRILVLPRFETMPPGLLEKITQLVEAGAVVYGAPPTASPSLSGYPQCDAEVRKLAKDLWGQPPSAVRNLGQGRMILDQAAGHMEADEPLLPDAGKWIWLDEGDPAHSATAGDVHFRYTWELAELESIEEATIEATADNTLTLRVNGTRALEGDDFNTIDAADVRSALRPGRNTIEVVATNAASNERNPAGFLAAMRLSYADGTSEVIGSDRNWRASRNNSDWSAAKELGPGAMAPWNLRVSPGSTTYPALYPDYESTAALLAEMQVPEVFQSDGPIRHGHRRTDVADVYFVANTTNAMVETSCTFRVSEGAPQLWDPVTAEIRSLPRFARHGKTTSVPMTFEPHQSFFVIFPRNGPSPPPAAAGAVNFAAARPLQTLEGPWEVSFDPRWGGPEKVAFDRLQDWTEREERGIEYYSGIATYRKTFGSSRGAGPRIYLDLGVVHDIARVRLNGEDLGVVWCAPWRVEITDAVKSGTNELEIEVANRWPNRLLGDSQPPDKDARAVQWDTGLLDGREFKTGRYTFTTGEGPGQLLPSGLLGPVTLQSSSQ